MGSFGCRGEEPYPILLYRFGWRPRSGVLRRHWIDTNTGLGSDGLRWNKHEPSDSVGSWHKIIPTETRSGSTSSVFSQVCGEVSGKLVGAYDIFQRLRNRPFTVSVESFVSFPNSSMTTLVQARVGGSVHFLSKPCVVPIMTEANLDHVVSTEPGRVMYMDVLTTRNSMRQYRLTKWCRINIWPYGPHQEMTYQGKYRWQFSLCPAYDKTVGDQSYNPWS